MFCHLTHQASGPRADHGAAEPEQAFLAGRQNYVVTESLHERTPLEAEQEVRTVSVRRATDECKPNRYSRKRLIHEDDAADLTCANSASDWCGADRGKVFRYEQDVAGDTAVYNLVADSPNQKVPGWSPDMYSHADVSVDAPEGGGAREMLNEYEIAARAHCHPSESGIRQMDMKDRDGIEIYDGSFGYRTAKSEASLYNVSNDRSYNEGLSPTDTTLEMCSYDPHIQPVVASKPVVLQSPLEFIAGRCSPMPHGDEQGTTTMTGIDKNTRLNVADYLEQQYIKTMNQTEHLPARNIGHKLAYNDIAERQNYRSVHGDPFQSERDIGGRQLVLGRDAAARNEQSVFSRDVATRNEQSVFGRDVAARNEQSVFGRDVAARNEQSAFGRDVAARNEQSVFGRDAAARNEQSVFGRDVAARNEQSVFGRDVAARNEQSVFSRDVATRNEQSVFSRDVAARNEQSVFSRDVAARNEQSVFGRDVAARNEQSVFGRDVAARNEQSVFGRDVAARNEQSVFSRDVATRNEQSVFGRDAAPRNEQSVFGRDVAARNEQSVFGRDVAARNEQSVFGRDVAARNEQSVFGRDVAARNEQSVFSRDVATRNEQSVFGRDVAARNEQSVFGRDVAARNEQSVFPMSIAKTEFLSELSTKSEAADGKRYARVVRDEATEVPVCGEYRNYDDAHRVKLWTEFGDVCDGSTGRRVSTAERHSATLVQPVRRNDQLADRGQTHNEMVPGFGEQQPRLRHPSPVAVVVGRSSPWYATPTGATRAAMTPSNTAYSLHSSGEVAKTPGRRSSTPNRTPNIAPVTPCVRRPVQALELGGGTERTRETTMARGKKMRQIWPITIIFVSPCT